VLRQAIAHVPRQSHPLAAEDPLCKPFLNLTCAPPGHCSCSTAEPPLGSRGSAVRAFPLPHLCFARSSTVGCGRTLGLRTFCGCTQGGVACTAGCVIPGAGTQDRCECTHGGLRALLGVRSQVRALRIAVSVLMGVCVHCWVCDPRCRHTCLLCVRGVHAPALPKSCWKHVGIQVRVHLRMRIGTCMKANTHVIRRTRAHTHAHTHAVAHPSARVQDGKIHHNAACEHMRACTPTVRGRWQTSSAVRSRRTSACTRDTKLTK